MGFCSSCGAKIPDNARFCTSCGAATHINTNSPFHGTIKKCPNCGETVRSFNTTCPTCGFEFRDIEVSYTIQSFSNELKRAITTEQKISTIENFPIPNTKEDIIEFLLLASSNIKGAEDQEIFDAWNLKIEQSYSKAELSLKGDKDFDKIRSIYEDAKAYEKKVKGIFTAKKLGRAALDASSCLPQTIIVGAWIASLLVLLPLCNSNLDSRGQNGYQVFYMFMCIVGAIFLPYALACKSSLPKTVMMIGVIVTMVILVPLTHTYVDIAGASPFHLLVISEVIACIVIFFRTLHKIKKNRKGEK